MNLHVDDLVAYAKIGLERAAEGKIDDGNADTRYSGNMTNPDEVVGNTQGGRSADDNTLGVAVSSRKGATKLPPVVIGADIGAASVHPDYTNAKAGDEQAAVNVAKTLVTDGLVSKVKDVIGNSRPVIVPVASVESAGRNKLPMAASVILAKRLGLETMDSIVQANSPKRTSMSGLDRIFATPKFAGEVVSGQKYLLLDDTLTQGATFAALASHIESHGGIVIGSVALTGKQYSATVQLDPATLKELRDKYGDIESSFKSATGYGFESLTQSEGRYLANFRPSDTIRNRILEAGNKTIQDQDSGNTGKGRSDGSVAPQAADGAPPTNGTTQDIHFSKAAQPPANTHTAKPAAQPASPTWDCEGSKADKLIYELQDGCQQSKKPLCW